MGINQFLSIGTLINIAINLAPSPALAQNTTDLLILGNSQVINTVERLRNYTSPAGVAADFGTSAPEYKSAALWFEQTPQPTMVSIGRWAQTATPGELICAPITFVLASFTAISAGTMNVNIDGAGVTAITGLDFSAQTTAQGVAGKITTALQSAFSDTAVCVWNPNYNRFEFTGEATGTSGAVSFLTVDTGVDVSALLGGQSAQGGYLVPGLAAESALSAATLFDTLFGQAWYALMMPTISSDSDHVAVAGYTEVGSNNKHIYGYTSAEVAALNLNDSTSIFYLLKVLKYNRSFGQYSSQSAYAAASALARILTVDYTGNNTVITLMWKQEPGIVPENLNATQAAALKSTNANVIAAYNNGTAILQYGRMASGLPADVVIGVDNLALTMQTNLWNLQYLNPTKIPQTDAGMHIITTNIEATCSQFVTDGLLAPGVWNAASGFGTLVPGGYLATGFYVYAPSVDTQSETVRSERISPLIQVAVKLAGAVETINVNVTVNQ